MQEIPKFRWSAARRSDVLDELERTGMVVIHSPDLVDALAVDASEAMSEVLGQRPAHVECVDVTPLKDQSSIVDSDKDGRLHVDAHPVLTPHLVAMSCHAQSEAGGISFFADGWEIVQAIADESSELLAGLFLVPRKFRYPARSTYSTTLSRRAGSVAFHHATSPAEGDYVGSQIHLHASRARKIAFKMQVGDIYVINNHRMLHGRTSFQGYRRLQRTQAWINSPLKVLPQIAEACEEAQQWLANACSSLSPQVRLRLGLGPVAMDCLDTKMPANASDSRMDEAISALPEAPAEVREAVVHAFRASL